MKTLGLLGGLTYHATAAYYGQINQHVQQTLGNGHSASLVLRSFDFADLMSHFHSGNKAEVERQLIEAGKNLKLSGAQALVLCVNTGHLWADAIQREVGLPLLHIMDFTGQAIRSAGLTKVALLGTKVVMEEDFMIGRLKDQYGLNVLVPENEDTRTRMNEAIFGPLASCVVTEDTRKLYLEAVEELVGRGAQGVILGCTELQFVLKPEQVSVPVFETVELHARGVAGWMLQQ